MTAKHLLSLALFPILLLSPAVADSPPPSNSRPETTVVYQPQGTYYNVIGALVGYGAGGPAGAWLGGGKDAGLSYGGGLLAGSLLVGTLRPRPVESTLEGLAIGAFFPGLLIALPAAFFSGGDMSPGGLFGGALGTLGGSWLGFKIGQAIDRQARPKDDTPQLSIAPLPRSRGVALLVHF